MEEAVMVDGVRGEGGREARGRSKSGGANASVRLSEILPGARFVACDDIVARGCHDTPEACRPGDLFVARLEAGGDGHELAAKAIARGVAGIVAERIIPTFGTPLCIVPESAWAQARITHALAGDPARNMRVIAITGTSGKTTTAWLTASVLAEGGFSVGVLSDLGCLDGDSTAPVPAAFDRPAELAAWLGRLAASGCTHAVIEVSSAMLARHALAGVSCDAVVVTNLASAHLDRHGTIGAYHEIKARILDSLGEDGCLIANLDDARVRRLVARHAEGRRAPARASLRRTVGVALNRRADLTATAVERDLCGQTFLLRHAGDAAAVGVTVPVASFVRDALLAAAVGIGQGVPMELVARGLESTGGVPGRLDRIRRGQEVHVFVDQPTSGHALASTLTSLRRLTPGKLIVLAEEKALGTLGGGRRFAERVSRWCNDCLIAPEGVLDAGAGSRQLAAYARIDRLLSGLGSRDCVLLVGANLVPGPDPGDPGEPQVPLAVLVDAWLELAHPAEASFRKKRAA
jgi:UDP-N-acetylmuramyl tripeptide synthase